MVLRQWGYVFAIFTCVQKRNLRIAAQTFILEQMALFSASMRHSEANSFQLHFAVPALNRLSDKNNFHFLLYNVLSMTKITRVLHFIC